MNIMRVYGLFGLLVVAFGLFDIGLATDEKFENEGGEDDAEEVTEGPEGDEEEDDSFDEGMAGGYPGAHDHQGMLGLTPDEATVRMTEIFHKIDINSDGHITHEEAHAWAFQADALAKLVHGESEFNTLDSNKDGKICLEEMLTLYNQYDQDGATEEDKTFGEERFHAIDVNQDNFLSIEEIGLLLDPGRHEPLVLVETRGIMRAQDKNDDKGIDFHEYADTAEDKLTGEEMTALKKDFHGFDTNQDGKICEEEVKEVIRNMGKVELLRGVEELLSCAMTEEEKLVKEIPKKLSLADYLANIKKLVMSVITADGDLIRVPEKYSSLGLSFKNVEAPKSQGFGDDVDHNDAMFGDMTDEKIADLMKQFKTQEDDTVTDGDATPEAPSAKDEL